MHALHIKDHVSTYNQVFLAKAEMLLAGKTLFWLLKYARISPPLHPYQPTDFSF